MIRIEAVWLTDGHWLKFSQALDLPEAADPGLAKLKDRKKAREQVEELVRRAIGALRFDEAVARLKAAGVGCTEVLPLERVLEAPQAQSPGKLRDIAFRGFQF
ncbi:MAG TPA: CoA transferase [Burkholderiaceae bacterium]|nr:CoA transferase [Burkholderiaceae bacterium]